MSFQRVLNINENYCEGGVLVALMIFLLEFLQQYPLLGSAHDVISATDGKKNSNCLALSGSSVTACLPKEAAFLVRIF